MPAVFRIFISRRSFEVVEDHCQDIYARFRSTRPEAGAVPLGPGATFEGLAIVFNVEMRRLAEVFRITGGAATTFVGAAGLRITVSVLLLLAGRPRLAGAGAGGTAGLRALMLMAVVGLVGGGTVVFVGGGTTLRPGREPFARSTMLEIMAAAPPDGIFTCGTGFSAGLRGCWEGLRGTVDFPVPGTGRPRTRTGAVRGFSERGERTSARRFGFEVVRGGGWGGPRILF